MSADECFQRAVHCQQVAGMERSASIRTSLLAAAEDWRKLGLAAREHEKRPAPDDSSTD